MSCFYKKGLIACRLCTILLWLRKSNWDGNRKHVNIFETMILQICFHKANEDSHRDGLVKGPTYRE